MYHSDNLKNIIRVKNYNPSTFKPLARLHSLPSARGIKIADGKMRAWTYSWTEMKTRHLPHISIYNTYRKIACASVICLY